MYKSYSKFRQRFKESYTVDLGAGTKASAKGKNKKKRRILNQPQITSKNYIEKVKTNLEKNKERLHKSKEALERQIENKKKLENQVAVAWSSDFQERAKNWLKECIDRIIDIEASIGRLRTWIIEDENKLRSKNIKTTNKFYNNDYLTQKILNKK